MCATAFAQQRISDGTANAAINTNAVLEIQSNNKGLLLPRVALTGTANAAPLSAHVAGMHVYNTATVGDVTPGEYYNNGTKWIPLTNIGGVVGTLGAQMTIPSGGANVVSYQTNSFITLPPGKWLVMVTEFINKTSGFTGANESWWVSAWFSESAGSTTRSPDEASAYSGVLPPVSAGGSVTGSSVINNTSGANKTYYLIANYVPTSSPNATGSINFNVSSLSSIAGIRIN